MEEPHPSEEGGPHPVPEPTRQLVLVPASAFPLSKPLDLPKAVPVSVSVPWTRILARVAGFLLPLTIFAVICPASVIINLYGRRLLLVRYPSSLVYIYLAVFDVFAIGILVTFLRILFIATKHHSDPPTTPPFALSLGLQPFLAQEFTASPQVCRCYKDHCGGRWMPLRSRHCRTCRTCRCLFDHCCVWIGTDVASDTLVSFVLVCLLTPGTVFLGAFPFVTNIFGHVCTVHNIIWASNSKTLLAKIWWDKWYSWAVGPFWRYAGAYAYVYKKYAELCFDCVQDSLSSINPIPYFSNPSLTPIILLLFATIFGCLTAILFYTTMKNLTRSRLTIDDIRVKAQKKDLSNTKAQSGMYIYVPLKGLQNLSKGVYVGAVVEILDYGEAIYDLGSWKLNLRNFLRSSYAYSPSLSLEFIASVESDARKIHVDADVLKLDQ